MKSTPQEIGFFTIMTVGGGIPSPPLGIDSVDISKLPKNKNLKGHLINTSTQFKPAVVTHLYQ